MTRWTCTSKASQWQLVSWSWKENLVAASAAECAVVRCADEACARQQHLQQTGLLEPELPFGVTLVATAWRDEWLCEIASRLHAASGLGCGPKGHHVTPYRQTQIANGHARS